MSMKKFWLGVAIGGMVMLMAGQNIWSAEPRDITYKGKGSKLMKGRYFEYLVHCSDGKTRSITAWDKRKKWCVKKSGECTNDQLKAAKMACQ